MYTRIQADVCDILEIVLFCENEAKTYISLLYIFPNNRLYYSILIYLYRMIGMSRNSKMQDFVE